MATLPYLGINLLVKKNIKVVAGSRKTGGMVYGVKNANEVRQERLAYFSGGLALTATLGASES